MKQTGFSLVELSIVLVILGLLTGGILSGQALITSAQLRGTTTEYSKWVTVVQTFRDKYFALPGDMANAQSFWGVAHATPATCVTTASSSPLTCNGDGNGQINVSTGSNESFRFWQHLANAGLIEGTYTGVAATATTWARNTANSPSGKFSPSLWYTSYWGTRGAASSYPPATYDNALFFGLATGGDEGGDKVYTPEQAWNLDTKMDDGMALTGKIMPRYYRDCTTATTSGATADKTNTYVLSKTSVECAPVFMQAF